MESEDFVIERLESVDSTNLYVEKKYLKKRVSVVVRADRQTAGMGTKGRSFISDGGGLYFTQLRFYDFFPACDAFRIMIDYSVGVVKTLAAYGIKAQIKWPNDILAGGKKICGIYIKNGFCGEAIDYSLVGLGLNVNNEIAGGISDIAVSMKKLTGTDYDLDGVFFSLLKNVGEGSTVSEYRECSAVLGRKVKVIRPDGVSEKIAVSITDDGRLVLSDGKILSAAEIDLKIGI